MTLRSQRSPRGRAVLLGALTIFAGVQLSASVLLDYAWPQVRYPNYHEVLARLDTTAPAPNVIFLGSSRTMCLLNDGRISELVRAQTGDATVQCFNGGVATADPIVYERFLQDLLKRGARPRYLLIEVLPEGVNQRIGWLCTYSLQFLRWGETPAYLQDLIVTNNMLRFVGTRLTPLYMYRDQIRHQVAEEAAEWYEGRRAAALPPSSGPAPRKIELFQKSLAAQLRANHIDPIQATRADIDVVRRFVRDYRPGGNAAAALERLLATCQAHGIQPILLGVPLSGAHREIYTPEIEAAFQAYIAEVERKYSCRFLDYRAALPDTVFLDHHHANIEGGERFSERIAVEVLAPLWSGQSHPIE